MNRSYTTEQIARVAWAVKLAMQDILGDAHVSDPWWTISVADKDEFLGAVTEVLHGLAPPQLHGRWVSYKLSQGWRYGHAVDWVEKTHPYLVPWQDLTPRQQDKDRAFCAIVDCLGQSVTPFCIVCGNPTEGERPWQHNCPGPQKETNGNKDKLAAE